MNDVLLQTKAHVPRARPGLVARPRLIDKLDDGLTGKLTLVSAPAGSGKTTLIAEWGLAHTRASDLHLTWLSLDIGDNELPRFLTYLVVALRQVHANVGEEILAMLGSPRRPPAKVLLVSLLNDLASRPDPLLLILDDYHSIEATEIHDAVDYFLDHQPPSVHLALVTREDPPISLARRRARAEMTEIRQDELRFTEAETATFLNDVMGLKLAPDQVAALDARTEGWIAGLHVAALAMQGRKDAEHFVRSFTGSNRYILDYLVEEVFRRQPDSVQDFLLRTAILKRFTAPLCNALLPADVWQTGTAPPSAQTPALRTQSILDYLERTNLFLVPLDDERQWFRYHHLFADLLRHQLRRRGWATDDLQLRAARWYAENGHPAVAITHHLAAQSWDEAADLLTGHSETMLRQGETRTLLRWMRGLPETVVRSRPLLCLNYGWALILIGQLDAAETYLYHAESAAIDDSALRHGILGARSYVARMRNDVAQTIALSEEALALTPPGDHNTRSVLNVGLGIAYWQSGQLEKAAQALVGTGNDALQAENVYAHLIATGFLGTVHAAKGKLRAAADSLRNALDRAPAHPAGADEQLDTQQITHVLTIPESFTEDFAADRGAELRLVNHPNADAHITEALRLTVDGVAQDLALERQIIASLEQMGQMQAAAAPEEQIFSTERIVAQAREQFALAQQRPLVTSDQTDPGTMMEGKAGKYPEKARLLPTAHPAIRSPDMKWSDPHLSGCPGSATRPAEDTVDLQLHLVVQHRPLWPDGATGSLGFGRTSGR